MKPDWQPCETQEARRLRALNVSYAEIGARFERSPHAVKRHLQYQAEQSR